MIDKELITEYVERVFELYGLDKADFFYDAIGEDEEDDVILDLFDENYESEDSTLERISTFLGLTKQEIMNADKRAAFRYWDNFPFFALHDEFIETWIWNTRHKGHKPTEVEKLISAVFGSKLELEDRYDYKKVYERLFDKLKEAAAFDPRYYSPDSGLYILKKQTEEMFSFPECNEMIQAYLDMVYRAQSLFFKALKEDLSEEEQGEYNFLVSYFYIADIANPAKRLYYNELIRFRPLYVELGYREFWSYAIIRYPLDIQQPWRCIEFFDDMGLVQEYINAFPSAKKDMIAFSRLVKNFYFSVQWKKKNPKEEQDKETIQDYQAAEEDDENYNTNPVLEIYLEKTSEETADFEEGLEKLYCAASPPSMGGVRLPTRESVDRSQDLLRIIHRILGGNYDG